MSIDRKSLEMDNQQPSTSSSSEQKQEMAKTEDGQEEKRMKEEPKSEGENQVEDKFLIEELPPEMLMKILNYLDIKSIALSRLVNRRWNGIAREIIKSRDDVETVFNCYRIWNGNFKITGRRASLENFNKFFEDSKESPLYTRFRFDYMSISIFDRVDWLKFVSDFGQSVKSLKLVITECERDIKNMRSFAENLRDLLLIQLPNLSEFGFEFACSQKLFNNFVLSKIQLFPTTTIVQLPHLKILYLGCSFLKKTGLVTDLVRAAINLQRIESFNKCGSFDLFETFQPLNSLGKLQCLQEASICLTPELLSQVKEGSMDISLLKLKKLDLYVSADVYKNAAFQSDASVFFSSLFESNKDSLTGLKIQPLGFLPQLQLPKFNKLTNLAITSPRGYDQRIQVLPSGINLEETFPALQHLDLQVPWTDFFPHNETVPWIPNVKTLIVTRQGMTREIITRISQAFPNLKEFRIAYTFYGDAIENFPQVGTAIWTHLKQLQSLELYVDVDDSANSFPAVNSCFTGFSRELCEDLYYFEEDETSTETPLSDDEVSIFELELKAERKNPSILDLKDLKKLEISLLSCGTPEKMLSVSEKYGFQLMENLKYKIDKY